MEQPERRRQGEGGDKAAVIRKVREISSLDLRFRVREWESLPGAFVRKVYQSSEGEGYRLAFELFVPQKGTRYLIVTPSWISLERAKPSFPEKPPGFCMLLRKHLSGKRIERMSQHGFDRILEINAGGLKLVLEFVPPGNVILLDSQDVILSALRTRRWRDREIRVRSRYQYPPGRPDPFSMEFEDFRRLFESDRKAAAVLASELGLGPEYANSICGKVGLRPDRPARSLNESELRLLFEGIRSAQAIHGQPKDLEAPAKSREQERSERIEAQRLEAREKWKAAEAKARERADAIYRKFDTVEALLEKFSRKSNAGFEPLAKREGLHITVGLDGVQVPLDLKKSSHENAGFYYEQAKKAKRKLAGLEASMKRPLEPKAPIGNAEPAEYPDQERHKEWYRKFKWFTSSDGVLVVAGKNAEQNEILLKSHAEPEERCYHADIRGAAFTVIKSGGAEPTEQTRKEAAEFAAANSKAWTRGLGAVHVFSVLRKNVSKSTPAGMNLPKGSFIVAGQKAWHRNVLLRMALGADSEGRVLSGPESALKKSCPYIIILVPGGKKASDLSREIKSEFLRMGKQADLHVLQRLSLDEIARHVPFGAGELMRK